MTVWQYLVEDFRVVFTRINRTLGATVGVLAAVTAVGLGGPPIYHAATGGGSNPPPPPTGTANLWVDTNGGTCIRSATPAAYNDAAACSSFQTAYTAALCGNTVGVVAGVYGAQSVSSNSKACTSSTPVLITSVPGSTCLDNSTVSMPSTSISVSYVKEQCMDAYAGATGDNCSGIGGASGQHANIIWNTFDSMQLECSFFDSDHMRITNSTYGPVNVCTEGLEDMIDFRSNAGTILDVVMDHDSFLTVTGPPDFQCGIGQHVDSIQGYGIALTITNSTFTGCPGQCMIFRPFAGGIPGPLDFENNVFNNCQSCGQAIDLGDSANSTSCGTNCGVDTANGPILIQNNTFINGAAVHGGFNNVAPIFRNNIMSNNSCNFGSAGTNAGATYTNNVFLNTTCGTSAKTCTPSWVAPNASLTTLGDYHLNLADTCAIGAASQTSGQYSAVDFDGQARPVGATVDAGIDDTGVIPISVSKIFEGSATDHGGGANWPGPQAFAITGPVAIGDTILVVHTSTVDSVDESGGLWVGAGPTVGAFDSKGNVYIRDFVNHPGTTSETEEIWGSCAVNSMIAGDTVSTVGYPRGLSDIITILDVKGIVCSNTLRVDQTQHGTASFQSGGATITSGTTATTTQASELVVGLCGEQANVTGTPAVVSPVWTEQSDFFVGGNITRAQQVVTRAVSSTGTQVFNEVLSGGATPNCIIVTYKTS